MVDKIQNDSQTLPQNKQEVGVDTVISEAMLGVNSIVGDLCRALKTQVIEVVNLRKENESLKIQLQKK